MDQQSDVGYLVTELALAHGALEVCKGHTTFSSIRDIAHDTFWQNFCFWDDAGNDERKPCETWKHETKNLRVDHNNEEITNHRRSCETESEHTRGCRTPTGNYLHGAAVPTDVVVGVLLCYLSTLIFCTGDFSCGVQVGMLLGAARLLRVVTFSLTTVGPIHHVCRVRAQGVAPTGAGGCGDLLFSGHGSLCTTIMVSLHDYPSAMTFVDGRC